MIVLLVGAFFLAFGMNSYRYFYIILGGAAGVASGVVIREPLLGLPGLSEHPGIAGALIYALCILVCIFLATRFRRILAFLGGVSTGIILSRAVGSVMGQAGPEMIFHPSDFGAIDVLAGLTVGVLFLLFEKVFALLLTSAIGAALCSWSVGGSWSFFIFLIIGLIAQPLISHRITPRGKGDGGDNDRTGSTTKTSLTASTILIGALLWPVLSSADWVVNRVNSSTGRVIVGMGWRNGITPGEHYAVLGGNGGMVAEVVIDEVFTDTSYSEPLSSDQLSRIKEGASIVYMEEYEFENAIRKDEETLLVQFIDKYPDSKHLEKAWVALDKVRYNNALFEGSAEAFRDFRRSYPGNRFAEKAFRREEELSFQEAAKEGTEDAFNYFLRHYPNSVMLSGMNEVRSFLKARELGKIYAYQEFFSKYPETNLGDGFKAEIAGFDRWADELEFGDSPGKAIEYFGELGDQTAIPLLVGKLQVPELAAEARHAILHIGPVALNSLLEVLMSPFQSLELKDKVADIVGEIGEISAIPALRTYVNEHDTEAGHKALLMLADEPGR